MRKERKEGEERDVPGAGVRIEERRVAGAGGGGRGVGVRTEERKENL